MTPMYVIKLRRKGHYNETLAKLDPVGQAARQEETGYYSSAHPWQMVAKSAADRLTHKRAHSIMGKMKRIGYSASVEPE